MKYRLADTLDFLAQLMFGIEDSYDKPQEKLRIAASCLGPKDCHRFEKILNSDPSTVLVSPHAIVGLATNALAYCRSDSASGISPTPASLTELCIAYGDLLPIPRTPSAMALELYRYSLFYQNRSFNTWFELYYRLCIEVVDRDSQSTFSHVKTLVSREIGLDWETLTALTIGFAMNTFTSRLQHRYPVQIDSQSVTDDEIALWNELFSITGSDAVTLARKDLSLGSAWSFRALFERPLIRLGERAVVLRPHFLADHATPSGVRELVRRIYRNTRGSGREWDDLWGYAFERLAKSITLELLVDEADYVSETAIRKRWGAGKVCDAVLQNGRTGLAVEFATASIRPGTLTGSRKDSFEIELRRILSAKVEQILATATRIHQAPEDHITIGDAIIVSPSVSPINVSSAPILARIVEDSQDKTCEGSRNGAPRISVISISDYWSVLLAHRISGLPVSRLISDWRESELYPTPVADWIKTKHHDWLVDESARAFYRYPSFIKERLFGS